MKPPKLLSLACVFTCASVLAQQEAPEEVVVVGSYLKGSPEDAPSPIDVIGRDEIDIQNAVTIADITKNLTINSGSTTNTNFDTENDTITGKANVNLRNLGLNSTLVLFNGKRQVMAAAESQDGSEFVDVNVIPMAMLDRVEILKDGGSAVYGSDAIAGVVNFILRDDFEGLDLAADLTSSDRTSARDVTASALYGTTLNDGRTNLVVGAEWFDRTRTGFEDLGLITSDERVTGTTSQFTAIIPSPFTDLNPAYVNQAITAQAAALGEGVRFTDPLCDSLGYGTGLFSERADLADHHCREDTQAWRDVQVAQDRVAVMASLLHTFENGIELYGLAQFNQQRIDRPSSGAFGAIDSLQAILPVGDPLFGLGSRSDLVVAQRNTYLGVGLDAPTAAFLSMADLSAANPMTDAPILLANGGPNALASMGYQVSKRGVGAFDQKSESDTYGAQIGVRGDFMLNERPATFDVSFGYTENSTLRENLTVNRTRLELAQNGLGGPSCVPNGRDDYDLSFQGDPLDPFADPVTGGVYGGPVGFLFTNAAPGYVLNMRRTISLALTSTNHGQGDCLFLNPFLTKEADLPNDPALVDWIYQIVPLEDRENTLAVFDAIVTTELFDLGGGVAEAAFGYQFRDSSNEGKAYDLVDPGLTDFASAQPGAPGDGTYGPNPALIPVSDDHFYGQFTKAFDNDRDVHAVFSEMRLPVHDAWDVQLAVRYEDYGGSIGAATTPKVGVRWQAHDSLVLRGSFSEAFRAPNTGPIFKGVGFDGNSAVDPLARAEVRQGLVTPGPETDTVVAIIQNGRESPDLGNEEAETYNFGAIWMPAAIEGLVVSADYFRFVFENKVVNGPLSATLDQELANFLAAAADPGSYIDQNTFTPCLQGEAGCIVNPAAYATVGIQRSPQGVLQVVDFTSINAGEITNAGFDVAVVYDMATDWGALRLAVDWTHVLQYEPRDIPGLETGLVEGTGITDAAGTTGDGSVVRSLPADRANLVGTFMRGDHRISAIVRYVSSYDNLGAQAFNAGANPPKTVFREKVGDLYSFDFQYNFDWRWSEEQSPLQLTLGVVNAFDANPPRRDDFPQGYDSTVHDPRGRRFYVRVGQTL